MKHLFVSLLAASFIFSEAKAQDDEYIRSSELGVSLNFYDFVTPQRIRSSSLSAVLRDKKWATLDEMNVGLGLHYYKGLTKLIDFHGSLSFAQLDYPMKDKVSQSVQKTLFDVYATADFKLLSDRYVIQPYATAGLGGHKWQEYYGAYMPLGLGLNINMFGDAKLFASTQYRVPLTQNTASYHFIYQVGITGRIGKKKEPKMAPPPPPPPAPPKDSDGDGITDDKDKCPTVPGVLKYDGCPVPDSDKDGINDDNDKCPTVPGLAKYQGCPIPDTDKDGINDEEDKCPTVPGVARYNGCPIPDTDGDGINDEEDKCPNVAGPADNFGCPVIGIKSYEVVFKTGSAVLLPAGKSILDTVAAYLQRNSGVNVTIDGHTDNTGSDKVNNPLSLKRADAAKAYLVKKGIDAGRMTTAGFGSTQPVADNKTAEGRRLNRRIEIKIKG